MERNKCPICNYDFKYCQCMFTGSCHPDQYATMQVVYSHMYLLSKEQINHVIKLQKEMRMSYADKERSFILEKLEAEAKLKEV